MKTFIFLILSSISWAHAAKDILLIEGASLVPDSKVDALLNVTKITPKIPDYEIKYIAFPDDGASAKQANSDLKRELGAGTFEFALLTFLKYLSLPDARKKYEIAAELNPNECSSGILFLSLPGAPKATGNISGKKIGTFPVEKLMPVARDIVEDIGKKNKLTAMVLEKEFVTALQKKEIDYIINPIQKNRSKGYSPHPFSKQVDSKELVISHYQASDFPCTVLLAKINQGKSPAQRAALIKALDAAKPDWKIKPVSSARQKRMSELPEIKTRFR